MKYENGMPRLRAFEKSCRKIRKRMMIFQRADSIGIRPQSIEEPGVMHAQNTGLFK